MSINLALILTLLTLISGVVVAMDKLVWKTLERDSRTVPGPQATLVEYSRSFFPVLIFVLVLVVYLTQLPLKNLGAFGLFLEKVFKSWPLSKYIEYLIKKVDYQIEKMGQKKINDN